ncbi:hypothetical protein PENANT_c018G05425 [Penicillium antarcticum]|uniref:Uncharacterized protein n=1 Tax=Penicillium antarcticum TaxID=416450 RepID=A0A1V6Q1I4_9EURO|nr:uncharacterized protein N7508_003750 [Penicillium antarcticum]KAJ5312920.1 hypothetical protein N7508_003750 [Penicillium antarcticum]OQD83101.1 hypothetical protein PENANT_c018G05425 [Penicillium antarcticum]
MARTDIQYVHESAFPVSKTRLPGESGSLKRPSKPARRSGAEVGRSASYHIFSPQDPDSSQDRIPLPEVFDNSYSPVDLRKRGSMASSMAVQDTTSMEQPWTSEAHLMNFSEPDTSFEGVDYMSSKGKLVKPKVHIKPILRKMSRDDQPSTSIDLSRSSTEQEGLGIYMNFERDRQRSESVTGVSYRRTPSVLHNRSTSGTSQFSTGSGSSVGKPGTQYVHPMRQMPRAYTPPLGQSCQASAHDSEEVEGEDEDEDEPDPVALPEKRAPSGPAPPRLSLHIQDDSFTRLPGISQTNVASRPSFGYSRDETASPMSRTSLDFVFRSRTRTSTDPISRAATVQAARQAFEEKEAAKNRRLEKQQVKAEERHSRRLVKRNPSDDLTSPVAQSTENVSEKPRYSTVHERDGPSASWKSQSKSTWVLFMTWLRTRVFKFRRKVRKLR